MENPDMDVSCAMRSSRGLLITFGQRYPAALWDSPSKWPLSTIRTHPKQLTVVRFRTGTQAWLESFAQSVKNKFGWVWRKKRAEPLLIVE